MLEREGLVDIEPRRGAVVRPFDAADLLDLYEVRALIEPHARARARPRGSSRQRSRARRALRDLAERPRAPAIDDQIAYNEEFHAIVVAAAQSPAAARPRCAASPASRARSARPSGATRRSARSRCSAIASSCAALEPAAPSSPRR